MASYSSCAAGNGKSSNRPRVGKIRLFVNGKKFRLHPVYDLYGASRQGEVINISKFVPMKGNVNNTGYLMVMVRGSGDWKQKCVSVHRFVYECYHGIIPDGMVIMISDMITDYATSN